MKKHIMHDQYKEALFERQTFIIAWHGCLAVRAPSYLRATSEEGVSLTLGFQALDRKKMGWTRWHLDKGVWDVAGWIEELFNA